MYEIKKHGMALFRIRVRLPLLSYRLIGITRVSDPVVVCRMGGFTLLMFFIRFFVFDLRESPKFLMGRGRDAEAVESIHAVAKYNGVESTLVLEDLTKIDTAESRAHYTTVGAAVERNLERFKLNHIRALFATKELVFSTSLVMALWALIVSCLFSLAIVGWEVLILMRILDFFRD